MTGKGKHFAAGLDIGTSNIVVAVLTEGESARPAGTGWCASLGMRKGIVVDGEGVARSIRRAVEMAEEAAGVKITTVWAGFSGYSINVLTRWADISIEHGCVITGDHVTRLMGRLHRVDVTQGRRVLQVIPGGFFVDGIPADDQGVGRAASTLGVEARILTVDSQLVDQLLESVQLAGLRVAGIRVNPLVVAPEILRTVERELGTALVDLGGGTTAIAVFNRGALVDMAVIPVGGEHITSDVAIGVRTTLEAAEEVKRELGLLPGEKDDYVELPDTAGRHSRPVPVTRVQQIITSRVQEILDLVKQTINRLKPGLSLPAGAVLTGGGARLKGLPDLAARMWNLPVRPVALEEGDPGRPDCLAAWGLARSVAGKPAGQENRGLAVAAGGSPSGAKSVLDFLSHLRRKYPH
ncbi:MAG TPA: cell division protein FtsA [Desulfotomaculum sp.]|uniref:cell division protein FtsA n=1 Tax=Desulfofundulus thermobenzoicus TaxID=29376 RepID=UPI001773F31A|nr:cell division protein FtsA [Desulfofundulus thermobenzoicus]HHW44062.1 cell division protein FtsA [Desulfotomaculum sp.]